MKYCILTLFPEMIRQVAETSIIGRAVNKGLIDIETINIRDFSANKHNRVDDYPYGGGAGMVIEAEPVFRAVKEAKRRTGDKTRVVYLTPQAEVLTQTKVEELAREENLILLCGHYEGIDERVLEEEVTDYISIGDYVLTGGELGALVLIDAVSRFVPGVLSNDESSQFESLQDNLLEYPHFTRPETWHDKSVPKVLLCGDHKRINEWRYEESLKRTAQRRPDLLQGFYKIYIASCGSEDCLNRSQEFSEIISRYGRLLDYNRAKLQKEKRTLDKDELIVIFTDLSSDREELKDIFRNLRAFNSPAFIVDISGEKKASEEMINALRAKGLLISDACCFGISDNRDDMEIAALEIRKLINKNSN